MWGRETGPTAFVILYGLSIHEEGQWNTYSPSSYPLQLRMASGPLGMR